MNSPRHKVINTIPEYYRTIHIEAPKYPFFHIGRHEENFPRMKKIQASPLKHELYSVSLLKLNQGEGRFMAGGITMQQGLFIVTPFRALSWNIVDQKLSGIYVIFDREFIRSNVLWENFLISFPYFKLEHVATGDFPEELLAQIDQHFEWIHALYHGDHEDPFELIKGYMHVVFLLIRSHYSKRLASDIGTSPQYGLLARFESLVLEALERPDIHQDLRSPSFYASRLNIHINHLNAVLKKLTGKTTSEFIYSNIAHHAELLIKHKDLSLKEIAANFHFSEPTHFISFFKKQTGYTPKQYKTMLATQ